MYQIVCCIIFGIFIILGISDIINYSIYNFFNEKNNFHSEKTFYVPINGHKEDIEFIIRNIILELKKAHKIYTSKIIFIDCGMDKETRKICEIFCKNYSETINLIEKLD
ncbi:MAG: hypothetical protein ACI4PR_00550 [Acutalibacteraceae bacterium]